MRDRCQAAGVSDLSRDLAVLLTSEVVTNAVLHAASRARLSVSATAESVLVEVGDDSTELPQVLRLRRGAPHGRGMALLEDLADAWGVREEPGGKVVWFTVAGHRTL
ncbi:Histidine kinase-like ATPase domain-containing protein [Quadrisphaera granulorum]|uniref:Histidine kinase-like protein n=1 Tax=Quadrisphaera granulorum TaxID=317664 RepID=A0A315ZTC2_9ACTN|nr:histidine kinase-like protein [Quadrisphaera granulorum]SZE98529.1 Histidine kinase-like ATPase domain-containing protein [Quadrisphaera granulorum]